MIELTEKIDQIQFRQSALAEQFQRFCQFLNNRISARTSPPVQAGATVDTAFDATAFSEQVAQLTAEIEHAGQIISQRQPELADATVREFKFLLAAWADEAMIKTLGQDRLPIAQHGSIERSIFGTVHAGDEFFHKIMRMLERRNIDDISLAGAYWLALVQGFEGRYIGGVGATELRRYVNALQAIALQKIVLPDTPKPQTIESIQSPVPVFTRIGLSIKPKILLSISIGLLLLCLISLEVHWNSRTAQLTQSVKALSDLRQANTDQQEMK